MDNETATELWIEHDHRAVIKYSEAYSQGHSAWGVGRNYFHQEGFLEELRLEHLPKERVDVLGKDAVEDCHRQQT